MTYRVKTGETKETIRTVYAYLISTSSTGTIMLEAARQEHRRSPRASLPAPLLAALGAT